MLTYKTVAHKIFTIIKGDIMERIVQTGIKIDLHIHSQASSGKDRKKVKNNTLANIGTLIQRLNENNVNICAITDHDAFSYDIYSSLKNAERQNNSIQKVLPGIEFSVLFKNETEQKEIHVVAIFSDIEDSKIKKIEQIIFTNPPADSNAYSEDEFLNVLRLINLDTILIAHQKNTLTSTQARKNDANVLGDEKFLEFIYTDYFEAFEFKNKRNEVINKGYIFQNGLEDDLRFVTGTDCHDWACYPREDTSDKTLEFPFTYAKCLPTFKGLVMAITDHRRLKFVNSFFSVDGNYLESIDLSINNQKINIPLSRGNNVIIGDNSIGKSMLIHALTGFSKKGNSLPKDVVDGYKKYMKVQKIKLQTALNQSDIFYFDMQGEVRKKFEENSINRTEFLKDYFPADIDSKPYRMRVDNEISRMTNYLTQKFKIDNLCNKLTTYQLPYLNGEAESLTFITNLRRSKKKTESYDSIISQIDLIVTSLKNLLKLHVDDDDQKVIAESISNFTNMLSKYGNLKQDIINENDRIDKIATIIQNVAAKYKKVISDRQKRFEALENAKNNICSQIVEIIKERQVLPTYSSEIEICEITPPSNTVFEYKFVSKLAIEKIDLSYIQALIDYAVKNGKEIKWDTITEVQLQEFLPRYEDSMSAVEFFKKRIIEKLYADFLNKYAIIQKDMDLYEQLSAGFDSKIYFDLLSYESARRGIYIIDQPEDNVSQSAIHKYLLDRFKTMSENRQVLMITHNPQFIVNLDVDNVICILKEGEILKIQSGALEYSCGDYNILQIIADNIDGGLETIQKRWKRYEKVNNI